MSRKLFVIPGLILLLLSVFYIGFFQQKIKETIHLQLPINSVTAQFSDPVNLKKWFAPFSSATADPSVSADSAGKRLEAGEQQIRIQNLSIYSSLLTYSAGEKEKQFILSALPDTGKNAGTQLTLIFKNTLFKKWFGKDGPEATILQNFHDFKDYTEDSKRMYGFEINPVKVTDTAFLFTRKTVPATERREGTRAIFDNLIAYANKREAGYNGIRIFYSTKSEDGITLFASIGISKQIDIPLTEPYEFKMMPFQKNLLEANYQGTYKEADKVYIALRAYMEDHNLTSMAIPFQKFISDGYDFADDQVVQMKVYYPVY